MGHPEPPPATGQSRNPVGEDRRQFIRYLMVGTWNTVFGLGLYCLLTWKLTPRFRHAYMLACLLGNVLAITNAYLCQKFLVFRTRGNYLREYARFWAVYGVASGINLLLLPVLVQIGYRILPWRELVPYLAGACLTAATVIVSFFGHRHFSFRKTQ